MPLIPGIVASAHHETAAAGIWATVSAIGSPAHGYCAEGPEFAALAVADGASVQTWPDEIGSSDLTQATSGNRPLYDADGYSGVKPSIHFNNLKFMQTAAWASMAQPNMVAMVFRYTTAVGTLWDGRDTSNRNGLLRAGSGAYWIYGGAGTIQGGTTDTAAHLAVATYDTTDVLEIDGSSVASGNAGTNALTGITVGAAFNGGSTCQAHIPLVLVYDTPLDSTQKAALRAAVQSHYGTP